MNAPLPAAKASPQPTAIKPAAGKGAGRRVWFDLHSWVGLKLSVFMSFVLLTGTLAVLAHEIDWLIHPEMRVQPGAQRASWGEMVDAVRRGYPTWTFESIQRPEAARFAAQASMRTAQGKLRFVWVDPYRGTVTGDTAWFNAHRLLRNTHRHLMMPTWLGVPIVAALAVPLLISLVSSLYIYRHWWRGFLSWPRRERQRRFWGDLHRLLGVWSLAFVALIGLTGVWYLIESLGGDAPVAKPPVAAHKVAVLADGAAVDRAVAQAQARWPGFVVEGVVPGGKDGTLLLTGQAAAVLVRPRANAVAFDAGSGQWLGARDAVQLSVHQRISEMADPLHFGNFAGFWVKLVWFVFGAMLTALSLSGVYLYGLRIAESWRSAQRKRGRAA
ncbi:PepSY-associated TM helix domain-containing protein [Pseudomonas sp. CGJS7]|uniref:PepSY-associated TM helix domain-containing protein n=1 Tax=Pseudomonas sp. CGJS7 TaxID=3109348 RepID=UPI00300B4D92